MNSLQFSRLLQVVRNLQAGEEGQDLVEYALLVSLIALGCVIAIGDVTTAVTSIFSNISTSI